MRHHPLSRSARPRLELLEGREVPAGNVTATLVGGRLTLTGDDQANTLTLQVTPTEVTVTPDATTSVNGQAPGVPAVLTGAATSLAANLRGGGDSLAIDPNSDFALTGAAAINLGGGDNTLDLTTSQHLTLGGLSVTSGTGSNTVTVNPGSGSAFRLGTVTGRTVFAFGPGGDNSVTLTNTNFPGPAGVRVAVGSGGDNVVTATNVTVTGTLSVNTGRSTSFTGQTFTGDTLGGLAVTGDAPFVILDSTTINRNLSVIGVFSALGITTNLTVTGNVTMRSGGTSVGLSDFGNFAAGNVTLTSGGSSMLTTSGILTARNVSISGPSAGEFQAGGTSATISGNLSVTSRAKSSLSFGTLARSEIKGNVTERGGSLGTTFQANGTFQADRNVIVAAGTGSNSVTIGALSAPAEIRGNLTVSSGNGPLSMSLLNLTVGGATRIATGAGADTLTIDATTFKGAFTANTGGGDDTFDIAQRIGMPAPVTFGGRVTLNAGPDNDTLRLGMAGIPEAEAVFSVPTSVLNGGPGLNTFFASTSQFTGLTAANFVNWTNA